MLKQLQNVEELVARVEGWLLTFLVAIMLVLAVYNVFYRNALVPIQASIVAPDSEAAPAVVDEPASEPTKPSEEEAPEGDNGFGGGFGDDEAGEAGGFGGGFGDDEADADEAGGFGGGFGAEDDDTPDDAAGGFGGGFGADDAPEEVAPADEPAGDEAGGFGGGFGEDDDQEPAESDDASDSAGGFGGGFGGDEGDSADDADGFGGGFGDDDDEGADGFGGGFGEGGDDFEKIDAPDPAGAEAEAPVEKKLSGGEVFLVETIDSLKIEWIDILLRHLVLIVGFLGAMLATRRRKHITVDALTKVIPEKTLPYVDALTSTLSLVVCVFLAISGWDLVQISLEYPKELMSWAEEWTFQMVFPIGFGLLAFHFFMRVLEALAEAFLGIERPVEGGEA